MQAFVSCLKCLDAALNALSAEGDNTLTQHNVVDGVSWCGVVQGHRYQVDPQTHEGLHRLHVWHAS